MDAEERKEKQNKKIELFKECFKYIKKNFKDWDDNFDDPWNKEILMKDNGKNINKKEQFTCNVGEILPEEHGIYLFNSRTKFKHPYGESGIYYIGKASNSLKVRLKTKLNADYQSNYYKKGRFIERNNRKNLNHYYPYLNYYQEFPTTIYCKKIDKDFKDMVPLIEEILISAFFTKMGNRPPSNRTGPNQLIWTDTKISEKLKTVYDKLLSSKILG